MTTKRHDIYPVLNPAAGETLYLEDVAGVIDTLCPRFIQLRMKHADTRDRVKNALLMEEAVRMTGKQTAVVVNDDPEAADRTVSQFVHVGQGDVSPAEIHSRYPEMRIGYSTHTVAQFRTACSLPLSYIAFGPVFGTHTKQTGYEPVFDHCARVRALTSGQVVFIGGITPGNCHRLPHDGKVSLAVISALGDFLEAV